MPTIESWFEKPDEQIMAILGQDYVASALQGKLRRTVHVLTDERLYQKGVVVYRTRTGWPEKYRGSEVIEIKDITMTSFEDVNNVAAIIMAVLIIALGVIGHIYSIIRPNEMMVTLSDVSILFGLLFMLVSLITRPRLFIVDHANGTISTYARWYRETELSKFQDAISRATENVRTGYIYSRFP